MELQEPLHGPAADYTHDHPPVRNVNVLSATQRTLGQQVADRVTAFVGSWPFILGQTALLLTWITVNVYFVVTHDPAKAWDPYPFILLNLVLSFQAAYTGPIVMMSQNRQAEKDRLTAQNDFETDQTAEAEIKVLLDQLVFQEQQLARMAAQLDRLEAHLQQ